jgi:hypothetical protein
VEARQVGAPPAVDGLIVVAGEGGRAIRRREGLDERVLEGAEVLGLASGAKSRKLPLGDVEELSLRRVWYVTRSVVLTCRTKANRMLACRGVMSPSVPAPRRGALPGGAGS